MSDDQFTPESIDTNIEALLLEEASGDDALLTRALASLYPPPSEADAALERVHTRMITSFYGAEELDGAESSWQIGPQSDERAAAESPLAHGHRSRSRSSIRQMRTMLSAVAAVLIAALITTSFVLVFQSRGRPSGTAVPLRDTPTPFPTLGPSKLSVPGTPVKWQSHTIPADMTPYGINVDLAVAPSDGTTAYDCYPVPAPGAGEKGAEQIQIWVTHDLGVHWTPAGNLPELGSSLTGCSLDVDQFVSGRLMMFLSTQNPQTHRQVEEYWVSNDGGGTWSKIATADPDSKVGLRLSIDQMATVGGNTYAIYTQSSLWPSQVPTPTALPNQCHSCGFIAVTSDIVVSTDGMHTWQPVDESLLRAIGPQHQEVRYWVQSGPKGQAILLVEVAVSTAGTLPDTLWESHDGGTNWTQLPAPSLQSFEAQASPTSHSWYICGYSQAGSEGSQPGSPGTLHLVIACSMDGGITWIPRPALRSCQSCAGIDALYSRPYYIARDGSLVTEAPEPSCLQCENLYRLPAHSSEWQNLGRLPSINSQLDFLEYALAPSATKVSSSAGGYLWAGTGQISSPINRAIVVLTAPYPG